MIGSGEDRTVMTLKTDCVGIDDRRTDIKIVPLADNLEILQQQLKILRRRQKLIKGTGPLVAR
jgi:hypothetical protein